VKPVSEHSAATSGARHRIDQNEAAVKSGGRGAVEPPPAQGSAIRRPARTYRSTLRTGQAAATRARVAAAAGDLFARQGYTRTSVRHIAAEAGVAVETVYAIGGKATVFLRAFGSAFSGTTPGASLLDIEATAGVWRATHLEEAVAGLVDVIVESNRRSASLWTAYVEAARCEAALADAYGEQMRAMREDGRRVLAALVDRNLCPPPQDAARTVDEIWVILHPGQYVLLVDHAGWDLADYRAWMIDHLMRHLT